MKYKLYKKTIVRKEIDSVLLAILTNQDFCCDSILETDDRIIVRYARKVLEPGISLTVKYVDILYIHFSKKDEVITKICIYTSEVPTNEKDIQKKM